MVRLKPHVAPLLLGIVLTTLICCPVPVSAQPRFHAYSIARETTAAGAFTGGAGYGMLTLQRAEEKR